ncbi:MAG TPA: hypothetical protein V6C91_16895 [Coleofasciculaceae cyanobacterium]
MKFDKIFLDKKDELPLLILLLGVLFLLYLQLQIPDEVFFSGDAGPKLLLTKQFASGNFQIDLDLPAASWVRNLWSSGLYPFEAPFVYNINNQYYTQYYFIFPLFSAPFYALCGWRGLYIIPLVSTWIIWWRFYVVCQHFRLGNLSTSLGLATLIFASPLSLYSAMYWEHAPGITLAFWGLSIILVPTAQGLSKKAAILSGILIGLSVWIRQELILFVLALFLWIWISNQQKFVLKRKAIFSVSMLLAVGLFFVLNVIVYKHPLGTYSISLGINSTPSGEVYTDSVATKRFWQGISLFFKVLANLVRRLFLYLPITIFPIFYTLLLFCRKKTSKIQPIINVLGWMGLPILLAVPLTGWDGGTEWGPRYLLMLVPLIVLMATIVLNYLLRIHRSNLRSISLAGFIILLITGTYINTYRGTIVLKRNYEQVVLPALQFIRTNRNSVVAVPSSHIPLGFVSIFNEKVFFLVKSNEDFQKLSLALLEQGQRRFLYMVVQDHQEKVNDLELLLGNKQLAIQFTKQGKFGSHILYEASIVETLEVMDSKL